MKKSERLKIILSVIEENEVDTQEELTELLIKKGLSVSQSTISRDISELNLIKGAGKTKKFRYIKANSGNKEIPQRVIDMFKQVTISITSAENLVVIKTLSGNAGTVGSAIDAMGMPLILGTIAGDDTLLAVTKNAQDAYTVVKSLRNI